MKIKRELQDGWAQPKYLIEDKRKEVAFTHLASLRN